MLTSVAIIQSRGCVITSFLGWNIHATYQSDASVPMTQVEAHLLLQLVINVASLDDDHASGQVETFLSLSLSLVYLLSPSSLSYQALISLVLWNVKAPLGFSIPRRLETLESGLKELTSNPVRSWRFSISGSWSLSLSWRWAALGP